MSGRDVGLGPGGALPPPPPPAGSLRERGVNVGARRGVGSRGGLAPRSFAFGELLPPPPPAGSLRERSSTSLSSGTVERASRCTRARSNIVPGRDDPLEARSSAERSRPHRGRGAPHGPRGLRRDLLSPVARGPAAGVLRTERRKVPQGRGLGVRLAPERVPETERRRVCHARGRTPRPRSRARPARGATPARRGLRVSPGERVRPSGHDVRGRARRPARPGASQGPARPRVRSRRLRGMHGEDRSRPLTPSGRVPEVRRALLEVRHDGFHLVRRTEEPLLLLRLESEALLERDEPRGVQEALRRANGVR